MIHNNKGFGIVEIIVVIVVIGLIGFIGWKAWDNFNNSSTTTQSQLVNPDQAPIVNSVSDLDKSTATLDAITIDNNESTQLNSETNF